MTLVNEKESWGSDCLVVKAPSQQSEGHEFESQNHQAATVGPLRKALKTLSAPEVIHHWLTSVS